MLKWMLVGDTFERHAFTRPEPVTLASVNNKTLSLFNLKNANFKHGSAG